jgi:hypothetical protein
MSFGRKGLAPGQMAPVAPRVPPAAAAASPGEHDAVAARREAFIAAERSRNAMAAQSVSATVAGMDADPLAGLRNGARPATRREEPVGQQWAPLPEADRQRARENGYGALRRHTDKRFIFGEPHKRTLALAYVFWFIAGQGSLHRFYCGQSQSAMMQIGLLLGSVLIGLVFVPVAAAGIVAWFVWIFADLFLIPGMMRQFKAAYAPDYSGVFD